MNKRFLTPGDGTARLARVAPNASCRSLYRVVGGAALCAVVCVVFAGCGGGLAGYEGVPFEDTEYSGGAQTIPGRVMCAFYDLGGEGVAYHDTTPANHGSGELNPLDGSYLHGFRADEGVDTSYTKSANDSDNSPFNFVEPPMNMLYVGWTEPGEWTRYTVNVRRAGVYTVRLLYTSNRGGKVSLSVNGEDATGEVEITSTYRAEEPVEWRQWHHWNVAELGGVRLRKGLQVLTLSTISEGQMNYAYLDFD